MISVELLRFYPLFAGLNQYMLKEIALISNEVELGEGDWLFYEEAEAEKFFIVIEGAIGLTTNIYLEDENRDIEAADPIGPGEMVGWSALVEPCKYTLGGRAKERTRLIEIEVQPFRELLGDNPEFGYLIMKHVAEVISDRLSNKCIQLLSLVLDTKKFPVEKLYVQNDNG